VCAAFYDCLKSEGVEIYARILELDNQDMPKLCGN
jgi:hypothetical protein